MTDDKASGSIRATWHDLLWLARPLRDGLIPPSRQRQVYKWCERSLREGKERLLAQGIPERTIDDARLPVMALLDESAGLGGADRGHEGWQSLQGTFLGHEAAGSHVFETLQRVRRMPETPLAILQLYLRCLNLGFRGAYGSESQSALETLVEELRQDIRRRLEAPAPLCATWASPRDAHDPSPRLSLRQRGLVATLAGLLLVGGLIFTLWWTSRVAALDLEQQRVMLEGRPG